MTKANTGDSPTLEKLYWGICPKGHRVFTDARWREENRGKTERVELGRRPPDYPRRVVPIPLPCGDAYYFTMRAYKRSDGTYYYA
jgi:hypothetical protein